MCPCACRSPLPNGSFARLPTCCATEAQPGRAFQSLRSAPPVPRKLLGLQALRGMPPTPSLQVSPSTMPRPRADSPTEDRHRSPTRRPAHGPRVLPHWGLMTGRAKPSVQGQVSHAQEPEPALCTQVPGSGCGSPFRAHRPSHLAEIQKLLMKSKDAKELGDRNGGAFSPLGVGGSHHALCVSQDRGFSHQAQSAQHVEGLSCLQRSPDKLLQLALSSEDVSRHLPQPSHLR